MIIRLVKLTFDPQKVDEFRAVFEASKDQIRAFPGCERLELLNGTDEPNIFFTYSYWNDPADLEAYRHSELFKSTWAKTKPLFIARAEAWSVTREVELP